jgi:3-phenylpropionate/cinnamic acid dioxygenase small subunit
VGDLDRLLLAREVEDLLYLEAELLDEWRLEAWLDLLTDDVRYFMPLRRNVAPAERAREQSREREEMSWFEEGKETLAQRVRQIQTGFHWAEEPLSRVCHLVSNVRIVAATGDEVIVRSRFLVYRNRAGEATDLYVGKREDVLRRVDGRWRIARRTVLLDQDVMLARSLTTCL